MLNDFFFTNVLTDNLGAEWRGQGQMVNKCLTLHETAAVCPLHETAAVCSHQQCIRVPDAPHTQQSFFLFFFFLRFYFSFFSQSPPVRSCVFLVVGPSNCGMWDATSAWLDEWCHVHAQDSNR